MYSLINYLNKNDIELEINCNNLYYIKNNDKFLNFMESYPLSYNIDDEIKKNKIDNILLYKSSNKKYNNYNIKINTIQKNYLYKSFYYDLEPIIKLSKNKSL